MSQKVLTQEWKDEFVASWDGSQRGERLAQSVQSAVRHAMSVLDGTDVGAEVAFEGSCPSGTTYESYFVWDGTPEMREAIAQRAYKHGGRDAWAARLVKVSEARGILSAQMRTG